VHRRRLLRSLALAGLGLTATACGLRRDEEPPSAPQAEQPTVDEQARDEEALEQGEGPESDQPPPDAPADQPPPEDAADDEPGDAEEDPAPSIGRVEVLCRDAVGLRPATATDARHRLERLTLHHTAVALEDAALAPERLRRHQQHHQGQGWSDIAYHYAVDLAGNVYELRDPDVPGDTFTDYDTTGHLHVVCEGNFESQQPPDALLAGVGDLLAALAGAHGLSVASLQGHRTYVPTTACPGRHLRARLGDLQAHAEAAVRAGAPSLELACGDQARQRLAAIEAG
jgi:hypothetical protein